MKIPPGYHSQGLAMQCRGCPGAAIALVLAPDEFYGDTEGQVVLDENGQIDEQASWNTRPRYGSGEPWELQVLSRNGSKVRTTSKGWTVTCKKGHENGLTRERADRIWAREFDPLVGGVVLHPFRD